MVTCVGLVSSLVDLAMDAAAMMGCAFLKANLTAPNMNVGSCQLKEWSRLAALMSRITFASSCEKILLIKSNMLRS